MTFFLPQVLASAEEEAAKHGDEAAVLRRAVDSQSALRAAAENRGAEEHRQRVDLQHRVDELEATAAVAAAQAEAREGELAGLRRDLGHARSDGLALAEEKARLEVRAGTRGGKVDAKSVGQDRSMYSMCRWGAGKHAASCSLLVPGGNLLRLPHPHPLPQVELSRVQRDFQAAEIMAMGFKEQLATRTGELSDLTSRHAALQQEAGAASAQLLESQASLSGLQLRHEGLQQSAQQRAAKLEGELAAERATLADVRHELAETQAERSTLDRSLHEASARETAVTAQLKQLASAHEQQTSKLRHETDARRTVDDELQAVRAGLQVRRVEPCRVVSWEGRPDENRSSTHAVCAHAVCAARTALLRT